MTNIPQKYGPILNPGEEPIQNKMQGRGSSFRYLTLAEVVRVDYEQMVCDLEFLQGDSPPALEVPISSAYWSKRSFLGAMPEQGAIAIVGFYMKHKGTGPNPFILSFVPNGFKTALRFDPFGVAERDAQEIDIPEEDVVNDLEGFYGPKRHKMRKIYPGEIFAMSDKGSELLLNDGFLLNDRAGGEIEFDSDKQEAVFKTLDFFCFGAGTRKRSGRVVRNALSLTTDFLRDGNAVSEENPLFNSLLNAGLIFDDGTLTPDINDLPSIMLPDGTKKTVITEDLIDPNDMSAKAFVENRQEIAEFSDQTMPSGSADAFDGDVIGQDQPFKPFITKVSGTVVGNDPYTSEGRSQYGRLLQPSVFSSRFDSEGSPRLETIPNEPAETEKNLSGAFLYEMNRPDGLGSLFLSHDKEGHCFISIPASTSNQSNMGAGRSVEADIKGSVKTTIGSNQQDGSSVDMKTKGGVKWSLGTMSDTQRSLDVTTQGGLSLDIQRPDLDGNALKTKAQGNVGIAVDGSVGISASNDYLEETTGKRQIAADSLSMQVGSNNAQVDVNSKYDFNVQSDVTKNIGGNRKTTLTKGNDTTRFVKGNRKTTFVAPATDNTTFLSTGTQRTTATGTLNVAYTTGVRGTYSFTSATGSYTVTLGGGSINLTAGRGVSLNSAANISLKAPTIGLTGTVGLGGGTSAPFPVIGGQPGPSPHLDYITGIPLLGNPTVKTV